jgi:hypothetical protein
MDDEIRDREKTMRGLKKLNELPFELSNMQKVLLVS